MSRPARRSTAAVIAAGLMAAAAGCGAGSGPGAITTPSVTPPASSASSSPTAGTPSASSTGTPVPSTPPATTASPASALPAWLAGQPVTHLPTTGKVVALTFDGGAGAQGAASVLATLTRLHVPATFFLTGQFVADNPATASALSHGNVVGNHTMSHPHATALSSAALLRQVRDAAARITAATGRAPQPWFRFPYGEYDARTLRLVHDLGYGAIGWTVDTHGWLGRSDGTAADVVGRVRAALRPGAIVLMHLGANPDDGTTFDADALPAVIAAVRAAGYSFVTVAG